MKHLTKNSPGLRIARDGEPFELKPKDRLQCCDCGLVHDVEWIYKRGKLYTIFTRNVIATRRRRKAIERFWGVKWDKLFRNYISPGIIKQINSNSQLWDRFRPFYTKKRGITARIKISKALLADFEATVALRQKALDEAKAELAAKSLELDAAFQRDLAKKRSRKHP